MSHITKVDLTLILLTWNRRYLIHSVLYNILTNKFPFKLIVVDNNSTDGTREYLLEHKDEIDKLILNEKNIGCVAFNDAIRLAEGNYVSLQADDHILAPNWVATMHKVIRTVSRRIKNIGYVSSILHYAIAKKGSMKYLRNHRIPYAHWFGNAYITIHGWKGTEEKETCLHTQKFGKVRYMDARAVGNGGAIIPLKTFKRIGLYRTYGLRGLYDGEFRTRCRQYGLRVGYTPDTAFVHVKEMFLNPKRYKAGYKSVKPTLKQKARLRRDWLENRDSAKKSVPPPSVPKL